MVSAAYANWTCTTAATTLLEYVVSCGTTTWTCCNRVAGMNQSGAQENSEDISAARKATQLLLSFLTDKQALSLREFGYFDVFGPNEQTYRLVYRRHGNVTQLDEGGSTIKAWCGHFGEDLPISDNLLSQLLMIVVDPSDYEDRANQVMSDHFGYCVPMSGWQERFEQIGLRQG